MLTRDKMDSEREASPFRKPENAIEIDTSNMSVKESVEALVREFRKTFPS
jgi:cytidylate kinase